jgi:steroid 5-alpha reductase family enzyme
MNFKFIQTATLLILALIIIPIFTINIDISNPLSEQQWQTVSRLVWLMIGTSLFCFVVGEITKNSSQVDKLWSIMPAVYVWIVAFDANFSSRITLMAVLVSIWAIRLTYNFNRKGGYSWKFWSGVEDYRWEVLRQSPAFKSKIVWKIFHLLFICLYQMSLILLFTLPIIVAWQGENTPIGIADFILSAIFIGFVVLEAIADNQQWDFQTEKYRRKLTNLPLEKYSKGFIDTGLWSKMRHPNYFAEQSVWVSFYFFSVIATGRWLNWSMMGAVLLVLLFQKSSEFSEKITSEKYTGYQDYIKNVPRFFPKLWS